MATSMLKSDEKVTVPIHGPRVKGESMKAAAWYGKRDIRVIELDRPAIAHPKDAILKVTSTAICGSDLHIYTGSFPRASMSKGDVLGHEFMGYVHEVGEEVKEFKPGDRVVACFDIACGECGMCKKQLFSSCDNTNNSEAMEALYGDRSAAEQNLLKLTPHRTPSRDHDLDVLLLSDVLSTAWHANELGEVGKGDSVAIWGAGPVGILAAHCAQHRGASKVILIDQETYRLDLAERRLDPRTLKTINFRQEDVTKTVRQILPHGPDVAIEAVGFHYAKSLLHKAEMALSLETDPSEILNEIFRTVRKGGRVSVVGVYLGYANHINFGCFMEKGLTMKAGQTPVQRYWKTLLKKVEDGDLNPRIVITHELPLEEVADGFRIFNDKLDDCVKVVLHTKFYEGEYVTQREGRSKAGEEGPH